MANMENGTNTNLRIRGFIHQGMGQIDPRRRGRCIRDFADFIKHFSGQFKATSNSLVCLTHMGKVSNNTENSSEKEGKQTWHAPIPLAAKIFSGCRESTVR